METTAGCAIRVYLVYLWSHQDLRYTLKTQSILVSTYTTKLGSSWLMSIVYYYKLANFIISFNWGSLHERLNNH